MDKNVMRHNHNFTDQLTVVYQDKKYIIHNIICL